MTSRTLQYKVGDKLEHYENGRWVPCVIIQIAQYVGKSGPGYYAAYDPPRISCSSFWTHDRALRLRDPVSDDMSTIVRTPDTCARVMWPRG